MARFVLKATKQHARNLAFFATIYKTLLIVQRRMHGKERPLDSFLAGLVGGYMVFGENNNVNQQVKPRSLFFFLFELILLLRSKEHTRATAGGYKWTQESEQTSTSRTMDVNRHRPKRTHILPATIVTISKVLSRCEENQTLLFMTRQRKIRDKAKRQRVEKVDHGHTFVKDEHSFLKSQRREGTSFCRHGTRTDRGHDKGSPHPVASIGMCQLEGDRERERQMGAQENGRALSFSPQTLRDRDGRVEWAYYILFRTHVTWTRLDSTHNPRCLDRYEPWIRSYAYLHRTILPLSYPLYSANTMMVGSQQGHLPLPCLFVCLVVRVCEAYAHGPSTVIPHSQSSLQENRFIISLTTRLAIRTTLHRLDRSLPLLTHHDGPGQAASQEERDCRALADLPHLCLARVGNRHVPVPERARCAPAIVAGIDAVHLHRLEPLEHPQELFVAQQVNTLSSLDRHQKESCYYPLYIDKQNNQKIKKFIHVCSSSWIDLATTTHVDTTVPPHYLQIFLQTRT